jgi:hypothetical protein
MIAFDAVTNPTQSSGSTNTFSYTHTAGSGSNKILLVTLDSSAFTNVTGVTCNGSAMTLIGSQLNVTGSGGSSRLSIWYFLAPLTGSNTIVITAASNCTIRSGSVSYTGALQTGQPDSNSAGVVNTSGTVSGTTTVVGQNCWLFMSYRDGGTTDTGSGGIVLRFPTPDSGGLGFADSNGSIPTGSQTISVIQGSSNIWGSIAFSLTPASQPGNLSLAMMNSASPQRLVVLTEAKNFPQLTFRQGVYPYSIISSLTFQEQTPAGSNVPVLSLEKSTGQIVRIYNNYGAALTLVADAINVRITTYDSSSIRTASTAPVASLWTHIYETGFGANSSAPGLYTQINEPDTMIGGSQIYTLPVSSNGEYQISAIRAGLKHSGEGFAEVELYVSPEQNTVGGMYPFVISVIYDFTS